MKEPINFKSFRTDFQKAVSELGKKYNISLKIAGIRYNDANFTAKLECNVIGKDTQEQATYKLFQDAHNLPLLGATFVSHGEKPKRNGKHQHIRAKPAVIVNGHIIGLP